MEKVDAALKDVMAGVENSWVEERKKNLSEALKGWIEK